MAGGQSHWRNQMQNPGLRERALLGQSATIIAVHAHATFYVVDDILIFKDSAECLNSTILNKYKWTQSATIIIKSQNSVYIDLISEPSLYTDEKTKVLRRENYVLKHTSLVCANMRMQSQDFCF